MKDYSADYELSTLVFYRENHGKQLYYSWEGDIWWMETPDKPKEKLFSIIGMNATKILLKSDRDRGEREKLPIYEFTPDECDEPTLV
jgi:hypothetical protein